MPLKCGTDFAWRLTGGPLSSQHEVDGANDSMMHDRTTSNFRRSILAWGLVLTVAAKSSVGAAFVLHRHGPFGAHWHVLGAVDVSEDASLTTAFGHRTKCPQNLSAPPRPVQTLAVVSVGLVYISAPRGAQVESLSTTWLWVPESTPSTDTVTTPRINALATAPARFAVRHVDAILLGSHAFLI